MKTSELTGAALDWAVAKCEGVEFPNFKNGAYGWTAYNPSSKWAQGGPIIEREDIATWPLSEAQGWGARKVWGSDGEMTGPTPLIAAMRCFVVSKLGDEVVLPEELK